MSRCIRAACMVLAAASASSAILIDGVVRDQNGQVVEGALVSITSEESGASTSAITGSGGNYLIDLNRPNATAVLGIAERPSASALFQNYPNPFNPETIITFQLETAAPTTLEIYNSIGQSIRTLVDEPLGVGLHRFRWNATDDNGQGVAAGTYFYHLTSDRFVETGKMTLLDGRKGTMAIEPASLMRVTSAEPQQAGKALADSDFFTITVTGDGFFDYERSGVAVDEDLSLDILVNSSTDLGMVRLALTDAPVDDADAVLVTINTVDIRRDGGGPWRTFVGESRTFDLLSLSGGVSEMLGEELLEPGEFSGVRLQVESAQIVIDGETFDLEMPSGEQRGLQLQGDYRIVTGETLDLMIDFDARRSITRRGQDSDFAMSPILRLVPTKGAGFITGHVFADGTAAAVIARQGDEEISSAIVDREDGTYRISFLEPGVYDLHVESELRIEPSVIEGIEVVARQGIRDVDFGDRPENQGPEDEGDDDADFSSVAWACAAGDAPMVDFQIAGDAITLHFEAPPAELGLSSVVLQTEPTDCNRGACANGSQGFHLLELRRLPFANLDAASVSMMVSAPTHRRIPATLSLLADGPGITCEAELVTDHSYEAGPQETDPIEVPVVAAPDLDRYAGFELPPPTAEAAMLTVSTTAREMAFGLPTVRKISGPVRFGLYGNPREEHWRLVSEIIEVLTVVAPSLEAGYAETHEDVTFPVLLRACEEWERSKDGVGGHRYSECRTGPSGFLSGGPGADSPWWVWIDISIDEANGYSGNLPTVRHEIGHALGMWHPFCGQSQMTIDHPQGQGRFFSAADLATIAAVHDARAMHGMRVDEIGAALGIPADDRWSALQADRGLACQVPDDAFTALFQDYATTAVLQSR
ncbi:MAG: DUF4382 domain-containing protein [Candidatus Latescibacteria bacterium]|nr:DUF4382 domain-containing protein [Candidatus Latescibacterota bacterium]